MLTQSERHRTLSEAHCKTGEGRMGGGREGGEGGEGERKREGE